MEGPFFVSGVTAANGLRRKLELRPTLLMDFIFADDARQSRPTRLGMGPLAAIGGFQIDADQVGPLERSIDRLCVATGFPHNEQFKWSPGKKEEFMRTHLVDDARLNFYRELLGLAVEHKIIASVIIEDTECRPARATSKSHEEDLTALFLERADWSLRNPLRDGVVVIASPSGGNTDEAKFLAQCVDLLESGTEYSPLSTIALGVLIAKSRHVRLLQLADVIASCTLARVAGEIRYSPAVFDLLRPLFRRELGRIGGVGVKIHPDFKYANLYYWLLEDTHLWRFNTGHPLPLPNFPYADGPGEPIVVRGLIAQKGRNENSPT